MAEIPDIKSYDEYLEEALQTFLAKTGYTDLNVGSVMLAFFEANTQLVYRATGNILQAVKDNSVDRATGDFLKKLAVAAKVPLKGAVEAKSFVTIRDSSFEKITTKVYAGRPAPNVGSTIIPVGDASQFPSTGNIYIGRGTPNVEGPLAYSAVTPVGSYYEITLVNPTIRFHNISETVTLSQGGNRPVYENAVVQTDAAGGAAPVKYFITENVTILDGEVEVTNVPIIAEEPGIAGNQPANAIKIFLSAPFPGATVFNPNTISSGRDDESDPSLRTRIKQAEASKGLGSATAIRSYVDGAQAPDESVSVSSSQVVKSGTKTTLFVDDGTGYERKVEGIGLEYIVDSAIGGEKIVQLAMSGRQTSVTKAFLISNQEQPYDISGGYKLSILVGGVLSEHEFASTDFRSEGAASAYEVVASINSNPTLLFQASTSGAGKKVVIQAKEEENNYLEISTPTIGTDSAPIFNFPSREIETLKLFKNDEPLSGSGKSAFVNTSEQSAWSNSISQSDTLIISVDGTAPITYTFPDQLFIDYTEFNSTSASNTLISWVTVINKVVTGVTASVDGLTIRLTSNLGLDSRASIEIDPTSTLVSANMFSSTNLSAVGTQRDYVLDRNTGQIELAEPLLAGDKLTAGTQDTFARAESGDLLGATVSLSSDASVWILADDFNAAKVATNLSTGVVLTVSNPASDTIRFTANAAVFQRLLVNDYVINSSLDFSAANRIEGRVSAKDIGNTWFEVVLTSGEVPVAETVSYIEGISFTRSSKAPQRIKILAGTYNIYDLADQINLTLDAASFDVQDDLRLVLRSNTLSDEGSVMIQHTSDSASPLSLSVGINYKSKTSLAGYVKTESNTFFTPYFAHAIIASEEIGNPPDSYITEFDSASDVQSKSNENAIVRFLNPYGSGDAQPLNEFVQVENMVGNSIEIEQSQTIKRLRNIDRFFVSRGYDLGPSAELVIILDNNPSEKTFFIPLYRNLLTNTSHVNNASAFNAYDADFSPTGDLLQTFGASYSFNNYKAFMKAKTVLDQSGTENAILFRSALWGKSGEFTHISYVYPQNANQLIDSLVTINGTTDIKIILPSGTGINSLADGTTEWNVTVTPNTPTVGVDMITVTYSGTGTPPVLNLSGGEYVSIKNNGEFQQSMIGTHRVSDIGGFTPTATSFSFPVESGDVVPQSNVSNLVGNTVTFFNSADATALEIVDYANQSLSSFISAELVDDGGTSGSGLIVYSTRESSNFTIQTQSLADGENYIESSNLGGTTQFNFKFPLTYISAQGYAFNDGEEIRLVPTTPKQIVEFMNTLAVTGLSTLASITTADKDTAVQIASNIIGSNGAVQIVGGGATGTSLDVINTALDIGGYAKTPVSTAQANAVSAGQLLKVSTKNLQEKQTSINALNTILVTPNSPLINQSTITIGNRQVDQMLFGQPRIEIDDQVSWKVEKQGSFVCISWNGQGTSPLLNRFDDCNFTMGADTLMFVRHSASTIDVIATGSTDFSKLEINDSLYIDAGDYVGIYKVVGKGPNTKTIRILTETEAISSTLTGSITITNNANLSGDSFTVGAFTIVEGTDWLVGVDATATAVNIATAISSLTGFDASASGPSITVTTEAVNPVPALVYNNVSASGASVVQFEGTPISDIGAFLGVKEGDTVVFSSTSSFNNLNKGKFRVVRVFENSFYIENEKAVEEDVTVTDSSVSITVPVTNSFVVSASPIDAVRMRFTESSSDFSLLQVGDNVDFNGTVLTVVASGTNWFEVSSYEIPSGTYANATLSATRPQILFFQYDAAAVSDSMVFTGNFFASNSGKHGVVRTLSPNEVVVTGVLAPIDPSNPNTPVVLGTNADNIYLEEETPYVGYKEIAYVTAEPANSDISYVMFSNPEQAEKINAQYVTTMEPTSRMGFPTSTVVGLDAYKHDIGMLAQVSRIVYGDPRDTSTYPGVSAAGADIFIEPPLVRRVQVGIAIRLRTGIPLAAIVEQVRNTVSALVDSNPVGESIAISSIIAAVDEIPGVRAIAITSPLYDATNDLIVIQPSEKSRILNPVSDISVSAIDG